MMTFKDSLSYPVIPKSELKKNKNVIITYWDNNQQWMLKLLRHCHSLKVPSSYETQWQKKKKKKGK